MDKQLLITVAADGTVTGTNVASAELNENGALVVKTNERMESYTLALSADGKTVNVDHAYDPYGDGYDIEHENFTLTLLEATGMGGTYRQDKNTYLIVADNGVITKVGSADSDAPYFGLVVADAEGNGVTVTFKTSAYSKLYSFHAVKDEKGNLVLDGNAGLYVADSADFASYYCSETGEYLYVFTVGETTVIVYREKLDEGYAYAYATIEGTLADGEIVTFTAGEKTATVKLADGYMSYASVEAGSYTVGDKTATLDGFGTMTMDDQTYAYTIAGDLLTVEGLGVYKLDAEAKTLTVATEIGYAGTYDYWVDYEWNSKYTLVLDGYGTATLIYSASYGDSTYVGSYTVADGKLVIADCQYSINGEWTLTHDGNAMEKTSWGTLYQLVKNDYEPEIDDSVFYGYWKNGETVIHIYEEEGILWLDGLGVTSKRPYHSWDGSVLMFEASDDCAITEDKPAVTFYVSLKDGDLCVTHDCLNGFDDDGYVTTTPVTEIYEATEAPAEAFAFDEEVIGIWYKADGTEVVITADGITIGGVVGTDCSREFVWGSYTYYFSVDSVAYQLYAGWAESGAGIYVGLADSWDVEELYATAPAAEDDAFAGTWNSGYLTWVFDGQGTVTNEDGNSYSYTVAEDTVSFTNGYYTITGSINEDGDLALHYDDGYGEDVFDKVFTKDESEEPVGAQIPEELWGTWSGDASWSHYDLVITADGAELIEDYDTEYATSYDFVAYEDGVLTLNSMAWGYVTLTITGENTAHFYMNRYNECDMVRGGSAGGDEESGIPSEFYGVWEGDFDQYGSTGHAVWTITADGVSLYTDGMDMTYRFVSYADGVLTLNCDGFLATMTLTEDGIYCVDDFYGEMDLTKTGEASADANIPEEFVGTWSGDFEYYGEMAHVDLVITANKVTMILNEDEDYPTTMNYKSCEDNVLVVTDGWVDTTLTLDGSALHYSDEYFGEFDLTFAE